MRSIWIGDAHLPWIHKPTFSWILSIIESYKPDVIGQVGDLFDFYSYSRFPKKPGFITAEEEVTEGRKCAEEFWRLIHLKAPQAKKYQIKGNHCDRPIKTCKEKAPELMVFVEPQVRLLYEFENVTTIHDSTEELIINGIMHIHGYLSKLGDHCKFNQTNVICGHSHRGGTVFFPLLKGKIIWEANTGHIADPSAEPLRYRPQKYQHWTRGLVLTDHIGPRFLPSPY